MSCCSKATSGNACRWAQLQHGSLQREMGAPSLLRVQEQRRWVLELAHGSPHSPAEDTAREAIAGPHPDGVQDTSTHADALRHRFPGRLAWLVHGSCRDPLAHLTMHCCLGTKALGCLLGWR